MFPSLIVKSHIFHFGVGKEEEEHLSKDDQGRMADKSVENNQKMGLADEDLGKRREEGFQDTQNKV